MTEKTNGVKEIIATSKPYPRLTSWWPDPGAFGNLLLVATHQACFMDLSSLEWKPTQNLTCGPAAVQVMHLHCWCKGNYSSSLQRHLHSHFHCQHFQGNRFICRNKTNRYSNVKVKNKVFSAVPRHFFQCFGEKGHEKCREAEHCQ